MNADQPCGAGFGVCGVGQQRVAWILAAEILVGFAYRVSAEQYPSAVALLRGVESVRTQQDSVRAELEIQYSLPGPPRTIQCLVEQDGNRRRFEVFAEEVSREVVIRDGDEFYGFRRKKHEDVHIYDLARAEGTRGDRCFDPRALGLTDLMFVSTTINACLWYPDRGNPEVVGQESLNGVDVWRVRSVRGGSSSTSEYWIEEPSFRVHRRTIKTQHMWAEIDSEFHPEEPLSPFPMRVIARRETKPRNFERIYTIKSLELGVDIPPERFTLASMDLPIATPVVDYRINRIIGYWNGEGLSDTPAEARGGGAAPPAAAAPEAQGQGRVLLIAVNLIVLLALVAIVRWRKRAALHRP